MSIPEAKHLARAMRRHSEGAVRVHGQRIEKGLVAQIDPLVVSLIGHEVEIEADSLLLGVNVRLFDAQFGIEEGDTVLLSRLDDGDWFVIDVISEVEADDAQGTDDLTVDTLTVNKKIEWAPGDASLYRYPDSNWMNLTSGLDVNKDLYVQAFGTWTGIGNLGPSAQPGIRFNNDTSLYRSAADTLRTDDSLSVGGVTYMDGGAMLTGRLYLGSPFDSYFERRSAYEITTNSNVYASQFMAYGTGSIYVDMGGAGGKLYFGNALDVTLYRNGNRSLRLSGTLYADDSVVVGYTDTGRIYFGSALDTYIYRSGAQSLLTNGTFTAGGRFFSGGPSTGGIWVDGGTNQFVGSVTANSLGFYNGGWHLQVHDSGQVRLPNALSAATALVLGGDANLYRDAVGNMLRTDDGFWVGIGQPLIVNNGNNGAQIEFAFSGSGRQYRHMIQTQHHGGADSGNFMDFYLWTLGLPAGADSLPTYRTLRLTGDGKLWIGNVLDTNLYRAPAGGLVTDGALQTMGEFRAVGRMFSDSYVLAQNGQATQTIMGDISVFMGGAVRSGIIFGNGFDTYLYRVAANILGVYLAFRAQGDVTANANATGGFTANTVAIGHTGSGYGPSIIFGNADARLYYDGASALRTPNNLIVDGTLSAGVLSPASISTPGNVAVGGQITFGVGDVNLYRRGQDNLQTDDTFWAFQNVVTGGKVYFNTNLVPFISSAGTDFTMSHQTWAPSFVSSGNVFVDYGNGGSRLYFGSDAAYNIYRDSANSRLRTPNNLYVEGSISGGDSIIASSYVQGIGMVYGNAGVSVYDTGAGSWRLLDGYGGGVRSSGHLWTTAGYSLVSAQNTYNRSTSSMVCLGVNDEVQLAYYSGALRINVPVYFDSIAVKSGESWTNVTYVNGWGGYGAPFFGVQFRKLASGLVVMRGLAQGGTPYTSICQLPPSYRPAAGTKLIFEQACSGGRVRIDIADDGYCYVVNDGLTGSAVGFTSFAGISFYAES